MCPKFSVIVTVTAVAVCYSNFLVLKPQLEMEEPTPHTTTKAAGTVPERAYPGGMIGNGVDKIMGNKLALCRFIFIFTE